MLAISLNFNCIHPTTESYYVVYLHKHTSNAAMPYRIRSHRFGSGRNVSLLLLQLIVFISGDFYFHLSVNWARYRYTHLNSVPIACIPRRRNACIYLEWFKDICARQVKFPTVISTIIFLPTPNWLAGLFLFLAHRQHKIWMEFPFTSIFDPSNGPFFSKASKLILTYA